MIERTEANTLITHNILDNAISYTQYREMIEKLLAENKTTGQDHSEAMVAYTRMNMQRMRRVEKTTVLQDETVQKMLSLQIPMIWVVLTEAWCGDAAQSVPAIVKIADASPIVEVKLLLRDEYPEIMDAYLTNGGRSIPKLIVLHADTLEELGTWGPRPAAAQELVMKAKQNNTPFQEMAEKLHGWYAKDRSCALQQELIALVSEWGKLIALEEQVIVRCS